MVEPAQDLQLVEHCLAFATGFAGATLVIHGSIAGAVALVTVYFGAPLFRSKKEEKPKAD